MKSFVGLLVACAYLLAPVSACGMGGIGAPSSGALIALCVIFLPVIIPVGGGYLAYKGISKGARAVNKGAIKIADNMVRRRNSDIIKTQMSRALKRVGRDTFAKHIQHLFDVAREEDTAAAYFDLGLALFLNKDLLKAEEYLNKAIDLSVGGAEYFPRLAHAHFVRGLVSQYMWAFQQAASDFKTSIEIFESMDPADISLSEDTNGIPQLTAQDARNSYGFALQLEALYHTRPDEDYGRGLELLDKAIDAYDVALDRASVKQGMWYHNRGVGRYFRTYRKPNASPQWIEAELKLALEDFLSAIHSGNFGTAADGYAMAAQTLKRLNKSPDEIAPYVQSAYEADPKVFMVELQDEGELATPWPLPRQDFPFKKSPHEFEKVHFPKPTWCDHCMKFIKNPLAKQGYECKKCSYHVHSKCYPQVKGKNCYNEELDIQMLSQEPAITHTHHFKPAWFHKPTWCDHCHKFVVSPVGKQGFRCTDCKFAVHKECALEVKGFIED